MNYGLKPLNMIAPAILCLDCGMVLVSWYGHDYKTCGCPNSAMIDGGIDGPYNRYGAHDMSRIQLVSVSPPPKAKPKKRSNKK